MLDLESGTVTTRVQAGPGPVVAVAASAGGDRLAIGHATGVIEVWDTKRTSTRLAVLQPGSPPSPSEPINRQFARSQLAIAFASETRLVAIDGLGLTVWDLSGASVAAHLEINRGDWAGQPLILHVSNDGRRVLAIASNNQIEEFRLSSSPGGRIERKALVQHPDGRLAGWYPPKYDPEHPPVLAESPAANLDGSNLACEARGLKLWDLAGNRQARDLKPGGPVGFGLFRFAPDGRELAYLRGESIDRWNLPSLEALPRLAVGKGTDLAWSPDHSSLFVAEPQCVGMYDPAPIQATQPLLEMKDAAMVQVAGRGPVISWTRDGSMFAHEGNQRRPVGPSPEPRAAYSLLGGALSPDGRFVAIPNAGFLGPSIALTVALLDVGTGKLSRPVTLTVTLARGVSPSAPMSASGEVSLHSFSANGGRLALMIRGNEICLIDTTRPDSPSSLRKFTTELNRGSAGLALSPDGRLVAVIGPGPNRTEAELREPGAGFLELYDSETGQRLRRVKTPWPRSRVVFSPDGRVLAAGGSRITLWSVLTLDRIASIPTSDSSEASALEFLPDARHLAGAAGSTVRLWDVSRHEELLKFDPGDGAISNLAVATDGTRIRYVATRRVAELNLRAFSRHIEGNLDWHVKRIHAELAHSHDVAGMERILTRMERVREEMARAKNQQSTDLDGLP